MPGRRWPRPEQAWLSTDDLAGGAIKASSRKSRMAMDRLRARGWFLGMTTAAPTLATRLDMMSGGTSSMTVTAKCASPSWIASSARSRSRVSTPASEGAFDAIAELTRAFAGRVWLVSKCGPPIQQLTRRWLLRRSFYERTGVRQDRVRFCLRRPEKREHCAAIGATHFVDDRLDVLEHLVGLVPRLYWFGYLSPNASSARPIEACPLGLCRSSWPVCKLLPGCVKAESPSSDVFLMGGGSERSPKVGL